MHVVTVEADDASYLPIPLSQVDAHKPFNVAIRHIIAQEKVGIYEERVQGLLQLARGFRGFISGTLAKGDPTEKSVAYVITFKFDTYDNLRTWLDSKQNKHWGSECAKVIDRADEINLDDDTISNSLFHLPDRIRGPGKWQVVLALFIAAYPVVITWIYAGIPAATEATFEFTAVWNTILNILVLFSWVTYITDMLVMRGLSKWLDRTRYPSDWFLVRVIEDGTSMFSPQSEILTALQERVRVLEQHVHTLRFRLGRSLTSPSATSSSPVIQTAVDRAWQAARNAPVDEEVSIVVTHNVHWEYTDEYLQVQEELHAAMKGLPGFRDWKLFVPPTNSNSTEYTLMFTFANSASMQGFIESPARLALLPRLVPCLINDRCRPPFTTNQSMVAFLFRPHIDGQSVRPPPLWKSVITASLVMWPFAVLFEAWIVAMFERHHWKVWQMFFIILPVELTYLVYLGIPFITSLVPNWMNSPRPHYRQPFKFIDEGVGIKGRLVLLVLYIGAMVLASFVNEKSLWHSRANF